MFARHFLRPSAVASLFAAALCGCSGSAQVGAPDFSTGISSVTGVIGNRLGGGGGAVGGGGSGSTQDQISRGLGVAQNLKAMADIGPAAEPAMGQSVAASAINTYHLEHNHKLTHYVSLVGLTLASCSAQPDANWCYAVLDTPKVNAFSGPDGYVMITRGAIERMHDESELAGVLAHEMSHVINQDGLHAAQQAAQTKFIAQTASAFDRHVAQFEQATGGAVDTIVINGYSKGQEDKADADAVRLVIAAGYDPHGYLHFIERMAAESHNAGENVFSTHPGLDNRVARIRDLITKLGSPKGQTLAERFAANTK
jgi:predicted Zn-dependent protease